MTRLRVWLYVALAGALAATVAAVLYSVTFEGDVYGFFRIGNQRPPPPSVPQEAAMRYKGEGGYDGQYFLALALDPLLREDGTCESLDFPTYRYRRMLFPLLGFLTGAGNPAWIPSALIVLNILCVPLLVLLVTLYLWLRRGPPIRPADALFVLGVPGVWAALCLTTSDLLSAVFLVAALCGYESRKPTLTGVLICAAGLTRETCLVAACAMVVAAGLEKRWRMVFHLACAVLLVVAWNVAVLALLPDGNARVGAHFAWPFSGWVRKVGDLVRSDPTTTKLFDAWCFFLTMATGLVYVLYVKRDWRRHRAVYLCAGASLAILACVRMLVLHYYVHYIRAFMDLPLLLILTLDDTPYSVPKRWLLILWSLTSAAFILNYILL